MANRYGAHDPSVRVAGRAHLRGVRAGEASIAYFIVEYLKLAHRWRRWDRHLVAHRPDDELMM